MSDLIDYFDNLAAHLAGDATLPELTAKQILFVTGPDEEDQIKAIDEHVKRHVMMTKGIAVVIFEAGATNESAEAFDEEVDARLEFEVRLFIHPQKWGPYKYDSTKRQAREILVSLVKSLNGAAILPIPRGCHSFTMVESWLPVPDPEFWAWNLECFRTLSL